MNPDVYDQLNMGEHDVHISNQSDYKHRNRSLSDETRRRSNAFQIGCCSNNNAPFFEGDRFINFRGNDDVEMHEEFETKQQLFTIDHELEEENRKRNQLIQDHQKQE